MNLNRFSIFIVLEAIQVLFLLGAFYAFIPMDYTSAMDLLLEKYHRDYKGDWQIHVYRLFVVCTFVGSILLIVFGQSWIKRIIRIQWPQYLIVYGIIFLLEISGLFGILTGAYISKGWWLFASGLVLFVGWRLLWQEVMLGIRYLQKDSTALKGVLLLVALSMMLAVYWAGGASALAVLCLFGIGAALLKSIIYLIRHRPLLDFNVKPFMSWAATLQWMTEQKVVQGLMHYGFLFLIVALIAVKDPLAAVAKMGFGEHFCHFDICLISGAWATASGNHLGTDQVASYGLGMPIMTAFFTQLFHGQVNHLTVFVTYISICIVYFLIFYLCLQLWLKNIWLAMAATLLMIKWQLFYTMSYPMTFIYPNGSVLRYLWDIPVVILLWAYLKTGRAIFLWAAGILIGWALSYLATTGLDLLMAWSGALFIVALSRKQWKLFWFLPLPLLSALTFYYIFCGPAIFTTGFWRDLFEFANVFAIGLFKLAIWENLKNHHYWDFMVACLIPLLYLFSAIKSASGFYFKKAKDEELIILIVSIYGLSLFQHYASMGVANNYYMRAAPLVFVLFHWISKGIATINDPRKRVFLSVLILIGCTSMLLGNKLYQSHPNVFNKSRNPMVDPKTAYPLPSDGRPYFFHNGAWVPEAKKLAQNNLGNQQEFVFSEWQVPNHEVLKDLYAQELTFAEDAALIAGLTAVNDKVPLISSFEVAILIQAKRRPFIFQFPLIVSRAMTIRSLPQTNILTQQGLRRAIGDFEKYKPEYIFMERMFLQTDIPSAYLNDAAELLTILEYVKTHYEPTSVGKYLVAMKRK